MTDPREAKLPVWAQELIADLRRRIQYGNEPIITEIARLRPQVALLKARNEALNELLDCAARGGTQDCPGHHGNHPGLRPDPDSEGD